MIHSSIILVFHTRYPRPYVEISDPLTPHLPSRRCVVLMRVFLSAVEKRIFKKLEVEASTGKTGLRIRKGGGRL